MNGPGVDVLAVLDKAIVKAEVRVASVRTLDAIDIAQRDVRDLYAARNAMAELIEAHRELLTCIGLNDIPDANLTKSETGLSKRVLRSHAALARIGGAK